MKYAQCIDGKISLVNCDDDFASKHDHIFPVDDDVQSGWHWDGKVATKPSAPPKEEVPSVEALGYKWEQGIESAMKLDFLKRMAEKHSATTVSVPDLDGIERDISIKDADAVVEAIYLDAVPPGKKRSVDAAL
jgi:hypothetical protein